MKKIAKTLATLLMLSALVGFMGCSSSVGGDKITPVGPKKTSTTGIVTFGQWPQSLKAESVTLSKTLTKYSGWDCYKGSDNAYYVERGAKFYKIEPIEWRVLTNNYNGKKLLFAEKELDARPYDAFSNNYMESDIRAFLNGKFYDKAFSKEEKAAICKTTVDNSNASTIGNGQDKNIVNKITCSNTEDNVFLLSLSEITNKDYGFDVYNTSTKANSTKSRAKAASDYTKATETWIRTDDDTNTYNGNGCYWLRSPIIVKENIYERDEKGDIEKDVQGNAIIKEKVDVLSVQIIGEDGRNGTSPIDGLFGVVPALTVPANL